MFAIGVISIFIFLGASIVIPAIFIPRLLGGKTGSEIYGILTTALIVAHLFTFLPKYVYETFGFQANFIFLIVMNLLSLLLINFYYVEKKLEI